MDLFFSRYPFDILIEYRKYFSKNYFFIYFSIQKKKFCFAEESFWSKKLFLVFKCKIHYKFYFGNLNLGRKKIFFFAEELVLFLEFKIFLNNNIFLYNRKQIKIL